jgi:DHA1 family bicyclomycin/chloramphenicol resistance-like MFS transporter
MVFIRDWFEGKKVAKLATIIGMIVMFSPLLAPIIGTGLAHYFGWKSIFYFLTGYALLIGLSVIFLIPESRSEDLITNSLSLRSIAEKYKLLFSNTSAVFILLSIGFTMAGMYTFITAGSFIYLDYFNFSPEYFPLLFGANIVLNLILSLTNNLLLKNYSIQNIFRFGILMQVAAGILLFIATLQSQAPFIPVFLGIVWFIGSLGMVFGNGTAMLLNLVPEISGSANAMIGLTRFLFGSAAGSLFAFFHTTNLIPVGIIMLSCAFLAIGSYLLYQKSVARNPAIKLTGISSKN